MRRLAASISKRELPPPRRLASIATRTLPRRSLACYALGDKVPDTAAAAFIAPSASIIGAVDVAEEEAAAFDSPIIIFILHFY